jgi:hypothetical protein
MSKTEASAGQTSSSNLAPNTSKNIRSPSKHKAKTLAAAAKTPREQKHCRLSQKHAAPHAIDVRETTTSRVSHALSRTWLLVDTIDIMCGAATHMCTPVPQMISRNRPACSSLLALREVHRSSGCRHCYPKASLRGAVDPKARLTYTTALRRLRQGLAHAFGGDTAAADRYGLHGLRAGGGCDALMRGVPPSAIKAQGHWSLESNVMEKHARFSTQQRMRFF